MVKSLLTAVASSILTTTFPEARSMIVECDRDDVSTLTAVVQMGASFCVNSCDENMKTLRLFASSCESGQQVWLVSVPFT